MLLIKCELTEKIKENKYEYYVTFNEPQNSRERRNTTEPQPDQLSKF